MFVQPRESIKSYKILKLISYEMFHTNMYYSNKPCSSIKENAFWTYS